MQMEKITTEMEKKVEEDPGTSGTKQKVTEVEEDPGTSGTKQKVTEEEAETNYYSKLQGPSEDLYSEAARPLQTKPVEEDPGTSGTKQKVTEEEAETNYYSKLQGPSEDLYSEAARPLQTKPVEEDPGTSGTKQKVTEEEAETNIYSKLQDPSEDLYSEAARPLRTKPGTLGLRDVRLWKGVCACLAVTCLLLLLIVIVLVVKLQTGPLGCQETRPGLILDESSECPDRWLRFGQSCFFLSTRRKKWDEAQEHCKKGGGTLAIITNSTVQDFLTQKGNLMYWIGLRRNGSWTWVDNSHVAVSYWSDSALGGDCVFLKSTDPSNKNWMRCSCEHHTYYICEAPISTN